MLTKLKKLMRNKKFCLLCLTLVLCLSMSALCFAASGEVSIDDLDFSSVTTAMTGAISPASIIKLIALTIAAGAGFVVAWFGIRKVKAALSKGIFKGKF